MIADTAPHRRFSSRFPSTKRAAFCALALLVAALGLSGCHISSGGGEPAAPTGPTTARPRPPKSPDADDERPYADMARTLGTVTSVPVRGRLVEEEGQPNLAASTPASEISQDEIKETWIEAVVIDKDGRDKLSLGRTRSDDEGYIDTAFQVAPGALSPGLHTVEIRVKGRPAGRTAARLLDPGHQGLVVRSDVDLTYLDTHFTRKRDMARLLQQSARERATLPAMERVYRALRAGASGAEDRPLVFISGSPRFFKRTLEARMALDKVEQDGLLLKAMDDIASAKAAMLDFGAIVPALKEQVGYKLVLLFNGRMELPNSAGELLLGDDSEADFITYSIYHRFLAGELDLDGLDKELARAGVDAGARGPVKAAASELRAKVGTLRAVRAIYINRTGSPSAAHAVSDWVVPGLTHYHTGAWPLILDLVEEGLAAKEAAAAVKARLVELGHSERDLSAAAMAAVTSGFLKNETLSM